MPREQEFKHILAEHEQNLKQQLDIHYGDLKSLLAAQQEDFGRYVDELIERMNRKFRLVQRNREQLMDDLERAHRELRCVHKQLRAIRVWLSLPERPYRRAAADSTP